MCCVQSAAAGYCFFEMQSTRNASSGWLCVRSMSAVTGMAAGCSAVSCLCYCWSSKLPAVSIMEAGSSHVLHDMFKHFTCGGYSMSSRPEITVGVCRTTCRTYLVFHYLFSLYPCPLWSDLTPHVCRGHGCCLVLYAGSS